MQDGAKACSDTASGIDRAWLQPCQYEDWTIRGFSHCGDSVRARDMPSAAEAGLFFATSSAWLKPCPTRIDVIFANPYWHALQTEQAEMAQGKGLARRYPADVIPFAGLAEKSEIAMSALAALLQPSEAIYVTGEGLPDAEELERVSELPGWQMLLPNESATDSLLQHEVQIKALGAEDAASMVALTNLAFPGFFRSRTYILGSYYGVHLDGELIAMAGERIALPGWREISAVCTHPDHTGRGYAAMLIQRLLQDHYLAGLRSMLHVSAANARAIGLYERLGFQKSRPILFNQFRRN